MKYIFLFCTFFITTISLYSQNLSSKSKEELNTMKQEALASEDYDLANKIKIELKTRVTIDEKIAQKNSALETALATEDYEKAELLNNEITKLKANKVKIKTLEEEKKTALSIEDFDRVIAIDKEIKKLKSLKPKNDRPLTTEQEIDWMISYYDQEIEEFDKQGGKYTIFQGQQRTQMLDIFKNGQDAYKKYKENINTLSSAEEKGIHKGFLPLLKLSENEVLIDKYRNYYLKKVTKESPYTYEEKINFQIKNTEKLIADFPKDNPNYEATIKLFNQGISVNKEYLSRINNLHSYEQLLINSSFSSIAMSSEDIPLDKATVLDYFPYPKKATPKTNINNSSILNNVGGLLQLNSIAK